MSAIKNPKISILPFTFIVIASEQVEFFSHCFSALSMNFIASKKIAVVDLLHIL